MSIQPSSLIPSTASSSTGRSNHQGCCKKRKHDPEETRANTDLESGQPLFSSTTFRRRWIESLKTAGNGFRSHLSSQTDKIRSLWASALTRTPSHAVDIPMIGSPAPIITSSQVTDILRIPAPAATSPAPSSLIEDYLSAALINSVQWLEKIRHHRNEAIESLNELEKDCKSFEESLSLMVTKRSVDLFKKDSHGNSALDYAIRFQNLETLKILTQTTSHKAFDSCRNIHDFFEILFPSYRYSLPPNWKEFIRKTPISKELQEFEKRIKQRPQDKKSSEPDPVNKQTKSKSPEEEFNHRLSNNPDKNSIEVLAEFLNETSFAFRLAWEIANRDKKVKLLEVPEESFIEAGKQVNQRGRQAGYNGKNHSISIGKESTFDTKIENLSFELFNALQRSSLQSLINSYPEREEYAFRAEWIEMNTLMWKEWIFFRKEMTLSSKYVETDWKQTNTLKGPSEEFISHTEQYRHQWDDRMSIKYLENNRDFLKRRLAELEASSAAEEESVDSIPQTSLS